MNNKLVLTTIKDILTSESDQKLQNICDHLQASIPHYNWVGFYFMNNTQQQLEIGSYAGKRSEHTTIPYGKGICGQVAISGETFFVQDVEKEENYLACSFETKSEIVVPMFKDEQLIGQIDIDSHSLNPFTAEDEKLLKEICRMVVEYGLV